MYFEYFDELNVFDDNDESFELDEFDLLRSRLRVIILTTVGDSFRHSLRDSFRDSLPRQCLLPLSLEREREREWERECLLLLLLPRSSV